MIIPYVPMELRRKCVLYFSRIPVDNHIQIMRVSVSETPNRVTTLEVYKP